MTADGWWRERRIGEVREALVEGGRLAAMRVRRAGDGPWPDERWSARVARPGWALVDGEAARCAGWPAGASEGARIVVEVTRAAVPERGRVKPAQVRALDGAVAGDGLLRPAGNVSAREEWPEWLAERWDEAWAAAELGRVDFAGGALALTPTPAHLAVDVDADAQRHGVAIAEAAMRALAAALRLYGVGGSVVADLPQLPDKAARAKAGEAFNAGFAGPFERTAVNGFGLMQIVLPRDRPSIIERAWYQQPQTRALALLNGAARDAPPGPVRLVLEPAAAVWLEARPALAAECARRIGRPVAVRAVPGVGGGHVESA